jgi:hypothetical protein
MRRSIFIKITLLLLALAGGIALGFYRNQTSSVEVPVKFAEGIKVLVYQDGGGDGSYNYDLSSKPLFTLLKSQKINIGLGVYDFVVSDSNDKYDVPVKKINIDKQAKVVNLDFEYSTQKLSAMLATEKNAAEAVILSNYPSLSQNYRITKENLYLTGEWYGAVLQPASASLDTYRVILHKQSGGWKIAVKEPAISIGIPSNPEIPPSVITKVDEL